MNTTSTEQTYQGKTAAEWKREAQESRRRSAESWERSDTDGFMSQWASDSMASLYDLNAKIAEQGGREDFLALFDLNGNHVPAKYTETRYGWTWRILEPGTNRTAGWFNESEARNGERRRNTNRRKGYTLGYVNAPCRTDLAGTMTMHAYVEQTVFQGDEVRVVCTEIEYKNR